MTQGELFNLPCLPRWQRIPRVYGYANYQLTEKPEVVVRWCGHPTALWKFYVDGIEALAGKTYRTSGDAKSAAIATLNAGRPLLVLAFSATKREVGDKLVPFAELYDGPMWRQVRASGYPVSNVAAVSALYGFLEPGAQIRTYDTEMDQKRMRRMCGTGNDVWRFEQATERAGGAFVVGGRLYQELARTAIRRRPELTNKIRFASGSYLQQRKQLGAWLRAEPGFNLAA
jgi:hypothetical protein